MENFAHGQAQLNQQLQRQLEVQQQMMAQQQELLQRLVQNQTQPQPPAAPAPRKRKAKGQGKNRGMPPPAAAPPAAVAAPPPLGPNTPASTSTGIFHTLRSAFGGSQPQLQQVQQEQQEEVPLSSNNPENNDDQSQQSFVILQTPQTRQAVEDDARSITSSHHHQQADAASIHSAAPPMRIQTPFSPPPPSIPSSNFNFDLGTETTKDVWITKCELQLNGQAVDQLESKQTKDQCINDYNRFLMSNGFCNSMQSNYINYALFKGGVFISAWDLSTSGFIGNSFVLPNIKTGKEGRKNKEIKVTIAIF